MTDDSPKHSNFSSHCVFPSALPFLGHSHTLLEVFSFPLMMRMSALVDILTLFRGGSSVVEGQQASGPAGSYPASGDLSAPRPRSLGFSSQG